MRWLMVLGMAAPLVAQVGRVDTIGGTTYDWWYGGPVDRFITNAPDYGIHATWIASDSGSPFPDRNMGYNFYGYPTRRWGEPVNGFMTRSGFGSLDCDPVTQVAVVSAHTGTDPLHPIVARDIEPGAGIFDYCAGPDSFLWPPIAVGQNRTIHCAMIDDATRGQLWYSRIVSWCNWDPPVRISGPDLRFLSHNIAASKVSQQVVITWTNSEGDYGDTGYYRISTDGGTTWQATETLPPPPAFGPDTLASFDTGLFPYFDRHDRLHIVADVMPIVQGIGHIMPAEIWHWCPNNTPNWSRIHRAGCDPAHLLAPVGYNALYACRPSIGEDRFGGLYVTWEQFDSLNVEPRTNLVRADIFYAQDSGNNGSGWQPAVKLTPTGTISYRFPCVMDYLSQDTLCVEYLADSCAGFYVQGQGPVTLNPVLVQFVGVQTGIEEERQERLAGPGLTVTPTLVRGRMVLSYILPISGPVRLALYDPAGRAVAVLTDGFQAAGRHKANWNTDRLPSGVYLARLETENGSLCRRLVVIR